MGLNNEEQFHGAFVFRNQGHGILSSTYLNTPTPKPHPETAILSSKINENDPFIGKYITVWIEEDKKAVTDVLLEITSHHSIPKVYKITWAGNPEPNYEGLGMMEGDLLVGCYWISN